MSSLVSTVSTTLSLLTITANVLVLALLAAWAVGRRSGGETAFSRWFRDRALAIGFVVSLIAMAGSLFYSEYAGYEPCTLCWYQRIFMYPQVLLFGIALLRRDRGAGIYGLWMSLAGAVIAAYHYYIQLGGNPLIPCGVAGYSVSCSQNFVLQFGYITIPVMAFSAFTLIAATMLTMMFEVRNVRRSMPGRHFEQA